MRPYFTSAVFAVLTALFVSRAGAQINIYNDGPIALDVRVKRCWSNQNFDLTGLQYLLFGPNEYTYKLRLRDVENLDGSDWTAWKTVAADNQGYVWSPDDNQIVFSYTYSGAQVPTNFEFEYDAFRNRCGGRTDYNCCEIFGLCTGIYDANRRQGVGRVPFRAAEPNVWTIAQGLSNDGQYAFQFEYRWRYTYPLPPLCPNPQYSDGPVSLTVWLDKVWADTDFDGFGFFGAEELNVQFRFKDNLEAAFPNDYFCFTGSQNSPQFNSVNAEALNRTYADIAANSFQYDFRVWEDDCPCELDFFSPDCPQQCVYNTGSECNYLFGLINDPDDNLRTATGSIDFRSSPPGVDNFFDFPISVSTTERFTNWTARIKYRWTMGRPAASVAPPAPVCQNAPLVLNGQTQNATYYQWQEGVGTSCDAIGQWNDIPGAVCRNFTVPTNFAGTKYYRLVVANRAGPGSNTNVGDHLVYAQSNCVAVTRNGPGNVPAISGPCGLTLPGNAVAGFSVPLMPGAASYTWTTTAPGATIVNGQGSNAASISFGTQGGEVRVTIDYGACGQATNSCFVTVDPTPTCDFIYVSPTGLNNAAGNAQNPVSLQGALNLYNPGDERNVVRMAEGTYTFDGILLMESGLKIEGGYRVINGNWTKEPSALTTINFTNCLEQVPGGTGFDVGHHIGIKCNFINDFALQDLVLNIPSVTGTTANRGRSVYGVYLNGASNYEITRVRITAGNASAGATGVDGADGVQGARGNDGGNGQNNSCGASFGVGGAGGNNVTINGAPGGAGGSGRCADSGLSGSAGTASGGVSGGGIGGGGNRPGCNIFNCQATSSHDGGPGGNVSGTPPQAAAGTAGPGGSANTFYLPGAQAGTGNKGTGGAGGGGGGAGGGQTGFGCSDDKGAGGGGGGQGGEGGNGGTGGWGGGASFGIYVVNNGVNGAVTDCQFIAGNAGAGGAGGQGGTGGQGGDGGNGGVCVVSGNCQSLGAGSCNNVNGGSSPCARGCDFGMGGRGGRGGQGGQGGNGGNGAAGIAANTQFVGGNPLPITGTYPTGNPGITLAYTKGCTNSEILLSETPPNAAAWNLLFATTGGQFVPDVSDGLSSYNVNAPNIAVYYTSVGYKDIQNGSNVLRKFVNIRTVRPLPVINPVPAEICAGESVTLSTGTSGTIYDWRILQVTGAGTPANPVEIFSSGTQSGNVVTLNAPGTYQIKLRVFENCCGWSVPVYRTVTVKRRPPAPQFVQSTARVCQPTSDVVYEIQPADGADTYQWTVAPPSLGSITSGQGTTQIAVTWFGVGTGTVVARAIGVGCLSGDATLNVEVIAPPAVALSANPTAICEGNEVTFAATGNGEVYRFTAQGGAVLQDWSGLSTFNTNELFFGQNLVVQAQAAIQADNGVLCLSPLSNPVSIIVSPIPSLSLTSSDPDFSICEGDFVTITANPQNVAGGTPRYIFYRNDNPNDILGEPFQTQNFVVTDGLRDGDVVYALVFNGPPTDCPSQPVRLDTFRVQRPPVTGNSSIVPPCGPSQTDVLLSVQNTEGSLIWQIATNLNYPNYEDIPGAVNPTLSYTVPQITGSDTTILYFRARYTVSGGCTNVPLASTDELFYLSRPPVADSATVCENGQATFFVPAPCPTCLTQWYDSPGASIPVFTGNTFTTPLLTAPVTYYVAFRYPGGCVSPRVPFKVRLFDSVFPNAQNQERCGPGNVTLSVTPDPINCPACTYNWYDNSGNYQQTGASFNTGNIALTTTYRVEAVSVQGCVGPRQAVDAIVRPLPDVQALALQPAICIGASTVLQASGAAAYSWVPATGLSASDIPNPVANPAATTTYTVTGTAADGCQKTATVTVTVNPLPSISAFAVDNTLCVGENTSTFSAGAVIYSWAPTDGVSNPSAPTPVLNPSVSTTYTVTGTDANGCTNTTTLVVEVLDLPAATASADETEICAGASTQLNATGGVSYVWAPSAGLSDATVPNPVASPSATRTYTVTATDANGCRNTASVTIAVISPPVLSAFADDNVLCIGETTSLTVAGGPAGVDYVWQPQAAIDGANIGTTVSANPQSTTTFTVSAVFGGDCVAQATVAVTVNPLPNVQISAPTDVLCFGQSVNLFATGAAAYVWAPATGLNNPNVPNPIATPATTTAYTVTGADANGCINTREITITVNALPVVSATATPGSICTGQQTSQLLATGAASYLWSPASGLSATNVPDPVANPGSTTTYTVTGTDDNGCVNTATVTVSVNVLPTLTATAADPAICIGASTTLNAAGAATYVWEPASAIDGPNDQAAVTANPSVSTVYTLTAADGNGCVNSRTVAVTVNPLPNVQISAPTDVLCFGQSVNLFATGAAAYVWSPATGLNNPNVPNPIATPATTTAYTVTGADANGCVNTREITITVNALPVVSATATPGSICTGQQTSQLLATGAVSYLWSPAAGLSNPTLPNPVANPGSTTTYTVTGTDDNGCTSTQTLTVTVHPLPNLVAVAIDPVICLGNTTTLSSAGATSFVWEPASAILGPNNLSDVTANPTATTVYTLTGTDDNGCVQTLTVTVAVNFQPTVSAFTADDEICIGQSVNLSATGAINYQWEPAALLNNPGVFNPVATPAVTTTFTVTGTNAGGCTDSDEITIVVHPLPSINATATPGAICPGQTTSQLSASGGVSYSWLPTAGLSDPSSANPSASPAATTTYTVTGTDANGCVSTATATVSVNVLPTLTATSSAPFVCLGQSATLTGAGAASYVWEPAGQISGTNAGISVTATPNATTVFTLTGTDDNGCVSQRTLTLNVVPNPVVSAVADRLEICLGQNSAQLTAAGAATYAWQPVSGLNNPNIPNPVANPAASTTYTVTGTTAQGCTDTETITITVHPLPTVSVSTGPTTICFGDNTTLTASGASTYRWEPTAGLSNANISNPTASPAITTTYTVFGTDANGCVSTASVLISVGQLPTVNAAASQANICSGQTTTLTASGSAGASYIWQPTTGLLGGNAGASVQAAPQQTTVYTITATTGLGCVNTATVTVNVAPAPTVTINPSVDPVCEGESVTLLAGGGLTYSWNPSTFLNNPNIPNPVASPLYNITYTVTVTGANGCQSTAAVPVFVYPNPTVSANVTPANPTGTLTVFFLTGAAPFDVLVQRAGSTQTWTRNGVTAGFTEFADMPAGAYLITVTDGNGCVGRTSAVINPPNCTLTVNAGTDLTVCSGSVNTLNATVAGAPGPVAYLWEPNLNIDNPTAPSVTLIPSSTTIYTVTVTSGVCFAQDAVAVNVIPEPALYAAPLQTHVCPGGGTVITATGAESYVWEPGGTIAPSITVTPPATTTYTVTGTTQGCSKSTTVTVNVYPAGNLTLNAFPNVACLGQTVQLQATGGTSYLWTPTAGLDDATSPTPLATPAQTTTYTVTGVDANGCPITNFITVSVNALPTAAPTASLAQICAGQTTTLTANASASAVSFEWQPASAIVGPNDQAVVTVQPGTTTTFTVRVRDAAGCEGTGTTTVAVSQLATLNATVSQSPVCPGEPTTLFATGATAYQWSPAAGLSNPNVANPVAILNETTTFTVTGTDPNGCSAQTTVTASVHVAPALSISPANATLCLGDNAPLSVAGAASYSWSPITGLSDPNAANPVAAPTATTTYTVRGTDFNGCVAQTTVTITVVSPPAVFAAAAPEALCAGQTTVLSVPGFNDALTYTWAPAAAIQGTNAGPTVVGAPLTNTTYTVTARDANGCQSTATVAVNVSNVVNLAAFAVPSQVCAGDPVTLYAAGATNYLWQPSALVSQPAQPVVVANPTATTTFTVTGYDPQGCLGQAEVTVEVFAPFDLTISAGDATLCVGEGATLTAAGAASYAWSPAFAVSDPNAAQVSVTPSSTTTYTVVGTDANGCTRSQTITITVVNPPNVSAGANASSVCPNATTTLFAAGAANYAWEPQNAIDGTNVGANVIARPSQTTVYTVTGTDVNGCSQTATVLVAVNPAPPVTLFVSDDFVCPGTEVQFSAAGASSYAWEPSALFSSPFGTGQTLTIFEATTVVVYGTDANGCVNSASATVNVFTPPTATVVATEAPNATVTVSITGGLAPYTVRIVGFGVNATLTDVQDATSFSGLNAGTYDVYVTDANGCRYATFVSVFLPGCDLAVYAGEDRSLCAGTSSTLTAGITGGAGEIAVSWAPASGLNTTLGATVVATPVSTTTYTVTAVSGICTSVDVVTIEVRPVPAVGAYTTTPAVCAGSAATLNALGAGAYVWTPGNLVGATVAVFPTQTTIYTVTGTSLGCSSTATVTVNVQPVPEALAETDKPVICLGESATLYASGGTSYQWSPTLGLSNPFVANPTATPTVTTVYTVTARNQFGCENTATVEIAVNPVPTAAIFGEGSALCYGQTMQITALVGPEYAYEWQPAEQISGANDEPVVILAPTQTTTFTLTVRNAEGCSRTAMYTQVVFPPSQVTAFAPLASICVGQTAPLFASGATNYRWEPQTGLSNPFVFNPVASPTETTTYTVYGTDMNGCVTTDEATITVHPLPEVVIPANATICLGQSVQLSVEGADVFVWQPATGLSDPTIANPEASPSQTTTYTVSAINSVTGCRNTGVVTVSVNGLPNVTASALPAGPVCPGQTVQLGANGANVYRWEPSNLVSNPDAANPTANPTQTTTFTVTGRNTFSGCENAATVTVAVFNVPNFGIAAQGPDTLCPGERLILTATAPGATNMQWTGPGGFSATGFTVTIENVASESAGDYVARGVGAGGCLGATDTVRVNVFARPNLPTIRADEPVCEGGTLRLFAESADATAFYWTGPNNWYSTEQNPVIASVDGRNHGSYQCRAIVGRCTSMVRTLGVYIEPLPPTPVVLSNAPICDRDELRLRVDAPFGEYIWTAPNGQTYSGAEVVIANATTDYRGEWSLVSYSGNCTTQTQRTFVVIGEPNTPNPRPIGTVCEGRSVKIEMRPPIPAGGYRLYLNETDEGVILFRESLTTAPLYETVTYYIEPVVAGCNIERVPLTINVDKVPFADISALPDTSRTLFVPNISTVQFKDLSQFADSVHWDFGDGRTSTERNPKHTYTSAGRFTVTFTAYSPSGCADTLVYGPYEVLDENIVGIPSAFTPNGDGLNEKFELYVAGYPTYCLKVFNRWGFMVFDNKCEALNFWDGTDAFSGQTCFEGVYTYQFKAQDGAGRNVSFHGTITLIR